MQSRLQRLFMVENLSAYLRWWAQTDEALFSETEFLNTLAARTGWALLIDVNNILPRHRTLWRSTDSDRVGYRYSCAQRIVG